MKHYSSVIIGHITMDRNVDHLDNEIRSPGGAVIFSSASAYALGHNVLAVTKVAKPDQERLSAFTLPAADTAMLRKMLGRLSADEVVMLHKAFSDRAERLQSFSAGFTAVKAENINDNSQFRI